MSENKTGKYFKYAIGEVVLVVIGILIALQINNWNEQKKQNKEVIIIKEALLVDLVKDTLALSRVIKLTKRDLQFTRNLIRRFEQPEVNLDTLKAIMRDYYPNYVTISSFNDVTFQSVQSTGKLNFLSKKLRTFLLENKKLQNQVLDKSLEQIHQKKSMDYTSKYPFGESEKNYVYNLKWNISDEKDFTSKLTTLLNFRAFFLNLILKREQSVLKKTKEIILFINTKEND